MRPNITKIIFVLFCLLYFFATWHGNLLTPDSWSYLKIARNIQASGLISIFGKQTPVAWPPLYSVILSAGLGHFEVYIKALHFICAICIFFIWFRLAKEFLNESKQQIVFQLILELSTPLLMIYVFVWSETIFLLCLSASLYFLHRYFKEKNITFFYLSALMNFFMLLQRYAGLFVMIGFLIGFLLAYRHFLFRNKFKFAVYFFVSISGVLAWMMAKIVIPGKSHIFGELVPHWSLMDNAMLLFDEVGANFVPHILPTTITAIAGLLVSAFALAPKRNDNRSAFLNFLAAIVGFYLLAWVIIPTNPSDISRFVAVVLPPFYLLVVARLKFFPGKNRLFSRSMNVLAIGILLYNLARILNNTILWSRLFA